MGVVGIHLGIDQAKGVALQAKPHVLLIHGDADPVVPFESLAQAEQALRALGVPVETVRRPRLPHAIDEEGLRHGARFLKNVLAG